MLNNKICLLWALHLRIKAVACMHDVQTTWCYHRLPFWSVCVKYMLHLWIWVSPQSRLFSPPVFTFQYYPFVEYYRILNIVWHNSSSVLLMKALQSIPCRRRRSFFSNGCCIQIIAWFLVIEIVYYSAFQIILEYPDYYY